MSHADLACDTPLLWRFPKSWNPYNVKPFLTDISVTVAQIQKIQKTRCIYFRILVLGGSSPPSQLVPKHHFLQISQERLLESKKFKKLGAFFFGFWFWKDPPHPVNWSPTHSTGPQTPFFTDISATVAQIQKIKKTRSIYFQ